MCGRYLTKRQKQEIAERFHVGKVFTEPTAPNYNIAPSTFQPIIRQERDSDEREMVLARWGLVPFFAKSLADFKAFSTINARAETITKAPTFRKPFASRRCIVPCDGFYEWKKEDDTHRTDRGGQRIKWSGTKTPYVITLKSGEPLAFGGVWDAWHDKATDSWLQSFSIITTEANELMSQVHTRMPVILYERDWARWLDRSVTEQPPIDLLRPYDSDLMQMAPCNPLVGNVKNNGAEMLVCPVADEPLSLLNSK